MQENFTRHWVLILNIRHLKQSEIKWAAANPLKTIYNLAVSIHSVTLRIQRHFTLVGIEKF